MKDAAKPNQPSDPVLAARALKLAGGDRDRAEELVQRVHVRVWQASTRRSEEIRSVGAFNHGVLLKIHQEYQREERRHRHENLDGEPAQRLSNPGESEDPADQAVRGELFSLVRRAIDKLTATSQLVVRLKYFEDLHQRQIASRLACNEVRVCRILQRARERLKSLLD